VLLWRKVSQLKVGGYQRVKFHAELGDLEGGDSVTGGGLINATITIYITIFSCIIIQLQFFFMRVTHHCIKEEKRPSLPDSV
jgi:hypothetical protein